MNILKFEKKSILNSYLTVSILGTSYKLNIKYINSNSIELKRTNLGFDLTLPKKYKNQDNIDIVNHAIMKLYSEIATSELEYSLDFVRYITKFAPEDYKIERLKNDFYKITKNKVLIINPDIVQYSREIINTTIIQAFCRIQHKVNSNAYKDALNKAMQRYDEYKKSYYLYEEKCI